jgi:hypothetical protein
MILYLMLNSRARSAMHAVHVYMIPDTHVRAAIFFKCSHCNLAASHESKLHMRHVSPKGHAIHEDSCPCSEQIQYLDSSLHVPQLPVIERPSCLSLVQNILNTRLPAQKRRHTRPSTSNISRGVDVYVCSPNTISSKTACTLHLSG